MTKAEKFRLAAEWLAAYEPAPSEDDQANAAAMREVADWLLKSADRMEQEASIRSVARAKGIPTRSVRIAARKQGLI